MADFPRPPTVAATGENPSSRIQSSYDDQMAGSSTDGPPTQEQSMKSKKRKGHRGGAKGRTKKINGLFDHDSRHSCDRCKGLLSSWSCKVCNRTLPNGKWAQLRLGAEDEDESMFGRVRLLSEAGVFSHEEQDLLYRQAKIFVKAFDACGVFSESWDSRMERTSNVTPETRKKYSLLFQSWIKDKLSAEDREDSFMGLLKRLLRVGCTNLQGASSLTWLARSLAKSWIKVEAVKVHSDREPLVWDPQFADFTDEEARKRVLGDWQKPAAGEGILDMAVPDSGLLRIENDDQQLESSHARGDQIEASSIHKSGNGRVPESEGPASTDEDMLRKVNDQHEHLLREKAEREQGVKELQAKTFQLEARRARAIAERHKTLDRVAQRKEQTAFADVPSFAYEDAASLMLLNESACPEVSAPITTKDAVFGSMATLLKEVQDLAADCEGANDGNEEDAAGREAIPREVTPVLQEVANIRPTIVQSSQSSWDPNATEMDNVISTSRPSRQVSATIPEASRAEDQAESELGSDDEVILFKPRRTW